MNETLNNNNNEDNLGNFGIDGNGKIIPRKKPEEIEDDDFIKESKEYKEASEDLKNSKYGVALKNFQNEMNEKVSMGLYEGSFDFLIKNSDSFKKRIEELLMQKEEDLIKIESLKNKTNEPYLEGKIKSEKLAYLNFEMEEYDLMKRVLKISKGKLVKFKEEKELEYTESEELYNKYQQIIKKKEEKIDSYISKVEEFIEFIESIKKQLRNKKR